MSSTSGRFKIAISGASSFTGAWIARHFSQLGWDVHGLIPKKKKDYSGLKKIRLEFLTAQTQIHESIRAEDGSMEKWIRTIRPTLWIHHHHWMENFRAPNYDLELADAVGLAPLPSLMRALSDSKATGVIFSGSFFEPGEGGRPMGSECTPYAQSKSSVWKQIEQQGHSLQLLTSKVVIPNPIGPFENLDRVGCVMAMKSIAGEKLVIRSPHALSDYLPIRELCQVYERVAKELNQGRTQIARPSGKVCGVLDWVNEVNRELLTSRLGLKPCRIEMGPESTAADFRNPEAEQVSIDWNRTWDHYREWLERAGIARVFSNTEGSMPSAARTK